MTRRLYVLRHAKSSWDDPSLRDRDRPLNKRGRSAAKTMRRHLRKEKIDPKLILCSPAVRTRETLEGIEPALGRGSVRVEDGLYGASARELVELLRGVEDDVESVLVIGHNPGVQDLVLRLARSGAEQVAQKFPTAALATLEFDGKSWSELDDGAAELAAFVRPRDLEK